MQIGRVTGLPEPTQFSQGDAQTVSLTVLANATQARQLLGHGENRAERFVPIVFGNWGTQYNALYELLEVSADHSPDLDRTSLREVAITARAENRGRQVANKVLLLRGDNRNRVANAGVTGPLYRAAVPSGAANYGPYNIGPAEFLAQTPVSTSRDAIVHLRDSTNCLAGVARATTANIALTGTVSVDGANAANNSRVLVKNQTTASQNGVYVVNTGGAWTRASDANTAAELAYMQVGVQSGTLNAGKTFFLPLGENDITVGTTSLNYQETPAFSLRESNRGGPVSISYESSLASHYDGACTITEGTTVVTGETALAANATNIVMDNGLVKVAYDDALDYGGKGLVISKWDAGDDDWDEGKVVAPFFDISLDPVDLGALAIMANSPDFCSLRYRIPIGGTVDISISRGSYVVTFAYSLAISQRMTMAAAELGESIILDMGTFIAVAPEAPTGAGFTNASAILLSGDGGAIAYGSGTLTEDALSGLYTASTNPSKSHVWGYFPIYDFTSKTGDDELYGMTRQFFAMLSQQTSAGVL